MSIWDRYPGLSTDELRTLTAVAAETMIDSAEGEVPAEVLTMPPKAAAKEIQSLVGAADQTKLEAALQDPEQSRQMALAVLDEVRKVPALAASVAEAYEARRREMCGPEMILLAGAVVILAIKMKSFSFTKEGIKASFSESGEAVKTFVSGLAKAAIPGAGAGA